MQVQAEWAFVGGKIVWFVIRGCANNLVHNGSTKQLKGVEGLYISYKYISMYGCMADTPRRTLLEPGTAVIWFVVYEYSSTWETKRKLPHHVQHWTAAVVVVQQLLYKYCTINTSSDKIVFGKREA